MKNTPTQIQLHAIIPAELAGKRLDQAIAILFPDYSRTKLQEWIKGEHVTVNGQFVQPRQHVLGGEIIDISAQIPVETHWNPNDISLNIIYEDESLLVINKPAGLVVHPAAGHYQNTLANAILHYLPNSVELPRAGIVHRLDKETSGLLVIAKTLVAQNYLVKQLQKHKIEREYEAIVIGVMTGGGTVDAPIGRHPTHRQRMSVNEQGKHAISHYRVIERFKGHTYIRVLLETGRTHQIRVHMAEINYPILGDSIYGARAIIPKGASALLIEKIRNFKRQALHAKRLSLIHPITNELMQWSAPLPDDMQDLLNTLRESNEKYINP